MYTNKQIDEETKQILDQILPKDWMANQYIITSGVFDISNISNDFILSLKKKENQ